MLLTLPAVLSIALSFSPQPFRVPLGDLTVKSADALWCLDQYKSVPVSGVTKEPIGTTYCRAGGDGAGKRPRLLFLHGADSNALEFRFVMRALASDPGLDCTSLDWWSGGFTERDQITEVLLKQPTPPRPWDLVREHIHAFWEQQLDGEPVILIGTTLGGAVAIDYAAKHPEAVSALVLIDAGGQSYKSPSPDAVTALGPVVLQVKRFAAFVQERVPNEDVRLVALHRSQPGWLAAGSEYLRSGSYQRAVGPELIRQVPMRTLVIWGEDDDILPVADADAFARDLPACAGVDVIAGSGHSPHLDNPAPVVESIRKFVEGL